MAKVVLICRVAKHVHAVTIQEDLVGCPTFQSLDPDIIEEFVAKALSAAHPKFRIKFKESVEDLEERWIRLMQFFFQTASFDLSGNLTHIFYREVTRQEREVRVVYVGRKAEYFCQLVIPANALHLFVVVFGAGSGCIWVLIFC